MRWFAKMKEMYGAAERPDQRDCAMEREIAKWARMYRQGRDKGSGELRLPAAVATELARLTVCELSCCVEGESERARYLNRQLTRVAGQLRLWAERGFAGGGMVLKACPAAGELVVECVDADCWRPLEWSCDGTVTAAEFSEHTFHNGRRWRRLERHHWQDGRYRIENELYDPWGQQQPLGSVPRWAELPAQAVLEQVPRPLFVCYRTPMANCIDPQSPLGVSVFAPAAQLIETAETQWGRILWEYEGGELAIDASEDLFEHRRDGSVVLPEGRERLFRAHDIDIGQSGGRFLEVFSPALRDGSLFAGLNQMLRRIEFNCGLAYGTLSDLSVVERTAQEVKAGRQRSYATVSDLQQSLEQALRSLCEVLDIWATLQGSCPEGDWSLQLDWGDSVLGDSETLRECHRQDVAAGLMTADEYRARWQGKEVPR